MYPVSAKEEKTCCQDGSVKVHADGSCIFIGELLLSVTHCQMDVTWFPFDEQRCEITFESKTRESKELNVTYMPRSADYVYEANGEWELLGKPRRIEECQKEDEIK